MCVLLLSAVRLVTKGGLRIARAVLQQFPLFWNFLVSPTSPTAVHLPFDIALRRHKNFSEMLRRCCQVLLVGGVVSTILANICPICRPILLGFLEPMRCYLSSRFFHHDIISGGQLVPSRSQRGCVWAPKRLQPCIPSLHDSHSNMRPKASVFPVTPYQLTLAGVRVETSL